MILVQEYAVLVENRRARRTVIVVDRAELPVPHDRAAHVERDEAVPAERRVDALAVCRRRRRRVAVLLVNRFGAVGRHARVPRSRAGGAIDRHHRQTLAALRGRDEDAVAPDDRRRVRLPGQLDLPLDRSRRGPSVDVGSVGDQTLSRWSAPPRPEPGARAGHVDHADIRWCRGRRGEHGGGEDDGDGQAPHNTIVPCVLDPVSPPAPNGRGTAIRQ